MKDWVCQQRVGVQDDTGPLCLWGERPQELNGPSVRATTLYPLFHPLERYLTGALTTSLRVMVNKKEGSSPKGVWAYGYEIIPPQSEDRLRTIKRLLDSEHTEAQKGARTWRGKVVLEEKVTHILVVSDNADQNHEINRKLEAEMAALGVGFSRTASLAVEGDAAPWPATNGLTKSLNAAKEQTK